MVLVLVSVNSMGFVEKFGLNMPKYIGAHIHLAQADQTNTLITSRAYWRSSALDFEFEGNILAEKLHLHEELKKKPDN